MSVPLQPGDTFAGRYRIEKFLAQGGFGAVFIAEQISTELRVALKVLLPHVLESRKAVEKFEQEARIAGRVNTDHIVRVIDAGFDAATQMPFLVMELLVGKTLDHLLEERGQLSPAHVVSYLTQTAAGLDRAHGYVDRNGKPSPIVHRDLKPENLFLARRDDGTEIVKILDFGIAKVLSETTNMTREATGTPLFMAYEQLAGLGASTRTDVWPLGLIAFQLLTGKSYWKAANSAESSVAHLFSEILSLPLAPPSERLAELGVPTSLGPAFDAWFLRCVERDAEKRFDSAGRAIAALSEALGVGPASRPSVIDEMGATSAASPALMAAPTLASASTASPQGGTARLVGSSSTGADLTLGATIQGVPKRSVSPLAAAMGAVALVALVGGGLAFAKLRGGAAEAPPAPAMLAVSAAPAASSVAQLAAPVPAVPAASAPAVDVAAAVAAPSASAAPSAIAPPAISPPRGYAPLPPRPALPGLAPPKAAAPAAVPTTPAKKPGIYDER